MKSMPRSPKLLPIIASLTKYYGAPPSPLTADPFEVILLENVAYLVTDERREAAFAALRKRAGTKPHQVLAASPESLMEVASLGGIHPEQRASRLREIALIAMGEYGGRLQDVLSLPPAKAKQALRKFPGIGEPGAEKVLLFARAYQFLALDSNGLRVLLRVGFGEEKKNYTGSYRTVREAVKDQLPDDYDWLISAHLLLRQHGKVLCKTTKPLCEKCPVRKACDYFLKR